jgi:cytochrome c5
VADREIKIDAGNKLLMVVSLLALAGALVFLLSHLVGFLGQLGLGERHPAPAVAETADQRMAPVGRVVVAAIDRDAAPADARPAAEVYRSVCAACHDTGAANAPKVSDGAEWAKRLDEKGLDTLVSHAINGFQGMPARGGNPNVTDEEVQTTVVHMLAEAGIRVDAPAAPAEAPQPAVAAASPEPVALATAAAGDASLGEARYGSCAGCHGPAGQGMGIFPKIAGQSADYVAGRLKQYRANEMVGPNSMLMIPQALGLSEDDIANLAAYIASF